MQGEVVLAECECPDDAVALWFLVSLLERKGTYTERLYDRESPPAIVNEEFLYEKLFEQVYFLPDKNKYCHMPASLYIWLRFFCLYI